jgi:hypothetical protein
MPALTSMKLLRDADGNTGRSSALGASSSPDEQARIDGMPRPFDSVRAMLAILLPVLWLVASSHGLLDQADWQLLKLDRSSSSIVDQGKHGLLDDACHLDSTARRLHRRLGTQSNADGSSVPRIASAPPLRIPKISANGLPSSLAPLGLAECWQFHWRTALAPRAPSRIS